MLKIRKEQKEVLSKDCAGRVHQKQIQALRERGFEIEGGAEKTRQIITDIRTPEVRHFRWTRNAAGFVSRITDPSDQSMEIDFDGNHQIGELRRNGRSLLQCQYSKDGNILDATFADGAHERLEYTAGQLVRTVNADEGETRFVRDAMLRLVAVVDPRGYSTWMDYDEKNGGLRGIVFPDGAEETYERGKDGIFTVKSNGSYHGTVTSDDNGTTERVEFADGHFLIVKCEGTKGTEAYSEYDLAGNRTRSELGDAAYDERNRILTLGRESFEHDQHGNLIRRFGSRDESYRYNGQGHLIEVSKTDGAKVEFAYDAFGRRIWKSSEDTINHYRWAGRQLLREWTERNNRIVERRDYVFLPGENYPLAVRIDGMPYYYHTDRLAPHWL